MLLFRIAQEALSNVRRHSEASTASITLDISDESITMAVRDNGQGFDMPERVEDLASAGRLGIMGMAERAKLLNGTLVVRSSRGRGTEVITNIPI